MLQTKICTIKINQGESIHKPIKLVMVLVHCTAYEWEIHAYQFSSHSDLRWQNNAPDKDLQYKNQWEIIHKPIKLELWFLCTAFCTDVIYKCINFQANLTWDDKVMLRTRKCDAAGAGQSDPDVSAMLRRRHNKYAKDIFKDL